MKGFEFRYEQVLKLRLEQEKSIKDELAKALKDLHQLQVLLEQSKTEKEAFYHYVEELLKTGVGGAELQSFEGNKRFLRLAIHKIQRSIKSKNDEIIRIRERLLRATMEKKKLEKLKEKQLIEYKKEELVAEEKMNDQIVTFNSSLRRR